MRISRLHLLLITIFFCGPSIRAQAPESSPPPLAPIPEPVAQTIASRGLISGQISLLARFSGPHEPFAAVEPSRVMIPASTQKVLTSTCVLDRLSASRTFSTEFRSRALPDHDGTLNGDLVLVGGGDPQLRAEDLWAAVRELSALGLRHVRGDLIIDDSLFAPPARPAAWPPGGAVNPYDASQGAAALAWNSIEIIVRPGGSFGSPAKVAGFPLLSGALIDNHVTTAAKTSISLKPLLDKRQAGPGGIRLTGTMARHGQPWRRWVHLGDPAKVTLGALDELFRRQGIVVDGKRRSGSGGRSASHLLVRRESQPLWQLVAAINKYSSNFGAEMLSRHLALASSGRSAGVTAADGARAVRGCLEEWEAGLKGAVIADSSGLSRQNRISAQLLVDVLARARSNGAWGTEFRASLARAGEDGSLRGRLKEFRGRLRAKTGSLTGVAGMAGYGVTREGREFVFAVLVNGKDGGGVVNAAGVDALVAALFESAEGRN